MTFGVTMRCNRPVAAWLLGLVGLLCAAPGWAFDLPELMGLLARHRSGEARFTEQREVANLDAPLTSSGLLSFEAPDRFVRRTLQPRAETLAVEGNTLTLTRGGKTRQFALDAAPEAVAIVEAIRGTLTGNAASLQRYFRTRLSGPAERWSLLLEPLDTRLAHQVREIRLEGQQGELRGVTVELRDGDRSVMQVEPLAAKP
jgi:Outer membrane lipoprotein carrier protein LolA-like